MVGKPMNAISDRITQAHQSARTPDRLVVCSCDDYETSRDAVAHTRHIVEATQAFIAADIETILPSWVHWLPRSARTQTIYDTVLECLSIARGTDR